MQITIKQLVYYARVCEAGSITRAARQLNVAQTALGLQVRSLEDEFGIKLFCRTPKGVVPTKGGRLLYKRCVAVLSAVDDLAAELKAYSDKDVRHISLGLAPTVMSAIGLQVVVTQDDLIPGVHLDLWEGSRDDILRRLRNGTVDWAIVHEATDVEGCVAIPVFRQPVLMVCRPGMGFAPGPVKMSEVLAQDLVLDGAKRQISRVFLKVAGKLGLEPKPRFEVGSVRTIKQILMKEGGVALFCREIVSDMIERGDLEGHRIVDPPLAITAYFVTRSTHSPTSRDRDVLGFLDQVLDTFATEQVDGVQRLDSIASSLVDSPAN
ncbi:MAG: LysR family transcriptional regulator [Roseicyclus sp.]|jgi:LysR family nitrogen assimilation transcriptional regulator